MTKASTIKRQLSEAQKYFAIADPVARTQYFYSKPEGIQRLIRTGEKRIAGIPLHPEKQAQQQRRQQQAQIGAIATPPRPQRRVVTHQIVGAPKVHTYSHLREMQFRPAIPQSQIFNYFPLNVNRKKLKKGEIRFVYEYIDETGTRHHNASYNVPARGRTVYEFFVLALDEIARSRSPKHITFCGIRVIRLA